MRTRMVRAFAALYPDASQPFMWSIQPSSGTVIEEAEKHYKVPWAILHQEGFKIIPVKILYKLPQKRKKREKIG